MSKNIEQVYTANPITTNAATDLMYFGQSPYGAGDDAAMLYSSFSAQFTLKVQTTKGDIIGYSTVPARLAVGATDGQVLQVSAAAATGLAWSTPSFPSASGTAGQLLRSNGTNNVYSTSTFADTYAVSTLLYAGSANTVSGLATANRSVLVTDATGVPAWGTSMTDGQLVIGDSAGAPVPATVGATGNLAWTVGAGTLSIGTTGHADFAWNDVAGTSQNAAVNNGYIISNASQTTVTLPDTAAVGSVVSVQGKGAAGWILQAGTGQVINLGNSPTSSAGTLTSTNQWDSVGIVCVTADSVWAVTSVVGNLTVA